MDDISLLNISGQIDFVEYPIQFGKSNLFCRYDLIIGRDWQIVSGVSSGISQNACERSSSNGKIVFNMPFEVTLKSKNIFGWPQLVVSLYGINYWGAEVSKGYVRIHIPINNKADQRAPIMTAKCSNIWSTISNCFLDRNPELKDPRVLTESEKLKEFHMETHGELAFSIQTILSSHSLDQ